MAAAGAGEARGAIKIVCVGDRGVGKGTFARRFEGAEIEYSDACGAEIFTLPNSVDGKPIQLWIFTGDGDMPDEFLFGASAAIVSFDVTSRGSYKSTPVYFKNVAYFGPNTRWAGITQVDAQERKVKPKHISFHRKKNLAYFDVSSFANFHVFDVISTLLRMVTHAAIVAGEFRLAEPDAAVASALDALAGTGLVYDAKVHGSAPLPVEDDDL